MHLTSAHSDKLYVHIFLMWCMTTQLFDFYLLFKFCQHTSIEWKTDCHHKNRLMLDLDWGAINTNLQTCISLYLEVH